MKNLFTPFLLFILAFITSCTAQKNVVQTPELEKTLLWEVSGNGLEKPSYLFGTFHMMCKDKFMIKDKVQNALAKTEQTVLEINFTDMSQMADMQKMMIADKKLSERMTPEETERFKAGLAKLGMKFEDVDQFAPMALYSTLMMKYFECPAQDLKSLDMELMQATLAKGKSIEGLETIKKQIEVFEKYLTIDELIKFVEEFDKGKALMQVMLNDYLAEDINKVSAIMHSEEHMSKEQQEIMLDGRNIDWLTKMPEMMKTKSTFFAVGAGHLPGDKGVIKLLRDKGYTVKPILN